MTAEETIVQALRDPGTYSARRYEPSLLTDGTMPEPQSTWQARAIAIALDRAGWLRKKSTVTS